MRDRIPTTWTFGRQAAAVSGRTAGVRPQGAAVPLLSLLASFICSFVFILFPAVPAWPATVAGTPINNAARADYLLSGLPVTAQSPTVTVTVVAARTPATIEFLLYSPGVAGAQLVSVGTTSWSTGGTPAGPFNALPAPVHVTPGAGPAVINLAVPVPLLPATQYHAGEPVFIRLTDLDQNADPLVRETVLITIQNPVTLDTEVLRILETGPNTGVFTGYIQTSLAPPAAVALNGTLEAASGSRINGSYTDAADAVPTVTTGALVDPYGLVFSSGTGLPVNGAVVTMINAATGLPATVYGDDGVSVFPSAIVSGGTATDSGGTVYTFAAGGYRFPFVVAPGTYRLVVTPPAGYSVPSQVADAQLQTLPNAPFALATPGSRGESFVVNPGPAIHIDIPLDPTGGSLWVTKTAGKQVAAVGEFIPYRLLVENTSAGNIFAVTVTDRLPAGFRYQKGSARLNGAAAADPAVSPDGRTLTFPAGTLAAGGRADIVYIAAVGAGARPGVAVNTAAATGTPGAVSNTAQAAVAIVEDLYRSTATIMGRVSVDACGDPDRSEPGGLAGVRIVREDGTFVVTDENGMYHFAAVQPGTHVVQIDLATVPPKYEVVACEENTRFAGTPYSQFVDLQGGTLWRADFHLALRPKTVGEVGIEIIIRPKGPVPGGPAVVEKKDLVEYTVPMHVGVVPARNLKLTIMLPEGGAYVPGTVAFSGAPLPADGIVSSLSGTAQQLVALPIGEPEETAGAVTFRFAELPADWGGSLAFDAAVPVDGAVGRQLTTGALMTADSPEGKNNRTPVVSTALVTTTRNELRPMPDVVLRPQFASGSADLTKKDKEELDRVIEKLRKVRIEHITVTGHTDAKRIRHRLLFRFPDNYALSYERAATIGAYLADGLGLHPDQVTYDGKGPDEPVATNATEEGRALNRRVELTVRPKMQIVAVPTLVSGPPSGMKAVATLGLRPGEEWPREQQAPVPAAQSAPELTTTVAAAATPGAAWLWPPEGHHPPIPTIRVAAKHDPAHRTDLNLNGEPVDGLYYDGMVKKDDGTVAVSRWTGVHLKEGDNLLVLSLVDADGREAARLERTVHSSGPAVLAYLVPQHSRLSADGIAPPVIAVRLLDKDGHPAREGTYGEFTVDPPHFAHKRNEQLQQAPLTGPNTDRVRYKVGADGVALIELAPTTQTGEAVVRFPFESGSQELRAWLGGGRPDWVLVGLAEGTVGYNVVTGNMESFGATGGEDDLYHEGRVAFYAKGTIKGEWLLTAAYDSAKETGGRRNLYQYIDPNKYYMLYGDGTAQLNDAPSAKKVYVKLERGQFYALFGDYATGLTVTELSRYSRNLTGVKSEYKGDRFEYNVFAADTDQAHVKDELRGDGTSGLYRLSKKNIVLNSESITLEARDRFRSEVIVSSQRLTRHVDYTIDYQSGTIFFKAPVPSRDSSFNPVFIVAEYETFDPSNTSYTYGGRAAVNALDKRVQVGVTHAHEGPKGFENDLTGVDAAVRVTPNTTVRAEVARTTSENAGATIEGSAYLAEVQHRSERTDGNVYIREQEPGFGVGQQNGTESGTRKVGGGMTYRMASALSLGGEVFRQENLSTGAVRDMAEARVRYAMPGYEVFAGLRHAEDTLGTGEAHRSEQLFLGAKYRFTERLTGRIQHDQTLNSSDSSVDYPTRTTLGVDYRLTNSATLFADQEMTRGHQADTATSRVGVRSAPWTGAQLNQTVEQQTVENGSRLFAVTGLKQGWQVNERWSLDTGFDRSATIHKSGEYSMNTNVPPASGGTVDFTAVYLGASYREKRWSATGRVEERWSEIEDKLGFFAGANGEASPGLGLAAGLQTFRTVSAAGPVSFSGDLRLGAAYRPRETRIIFLDRLDLIENEQQGTAVPFESWRVVNNFVLNYKLEGRTQWSFQYGAKFVSETIEKYDFRGYTDLTGIEGRYDITKKVDLGLRVSMLRTVEIGQTDYGTQASVGLLAGRNLWISVGYNFAGYMDRDFSKAEFTAEGPFVKLRMKFDQASVRDAVKWITGQQ